MLARIARNTELGPEELWSRGGIPAPASKTAHARRRRPLCATSSETHRAATAPGSSESIASVLALLGGAGASSSGEGHVPHDAIAGGARVENRPWYNGTMRVLCLGVVALAGCGTGTAAQEPPVPTPDFAAASAAPVPGSAAPAKSSAAPRSRPVNAGCRGYTAQAARACTARRGCSSGPPALVQRHDTPDGELERFKAGPCQCTCEAERQFCRRLPSPVSPDQRGGF